MTKSPRIYQTAANDYLALNAVNNFGGCLFMEMRLGKTFTMISYLEWEAFKAVLIVCPKAVFHVWESELKDFGVPEKEVCVLDGTLTQRQLKLDSYNPHRVYIVNYEMLNKLEVHLYAWDAIVLDESVSIANPKSARSKYLTSLKFHHVKFKYCLTGAPVPEDVTQYFQQMKFVFGKFMGHTNFWAWREEYFVERGFKWSPKNNTLTAIKTEVDRLAYQLKRAQVNLGGKKVYTALKVQLPTDLKRLYKKVLTKYCTDEKEYEHAGAVFSILRRISGMQNPDTGVTEDNKFKEVKRLLDNDFQNEKVIVWCSLRSEANYVYSKLSTAVLVTGEGCKYKSTFGETVTKDRVEALSMFKEFAAYKVIVLTFACKAGINLSVADTAIYYSTPPSGDARQQSEDRVIGQDTKDKFIIDILTEGTVDERIHELLKDKSMTQDLMMSTLFSEIRKGKQ